MRTLPIVLSLAWALTGCNRPDPSIVPTATRDMVAPIDVQALAHDVARIRRVNMLHPVAVRTLPGWIMAQRLQSRDGAPLGDTASASAFGFAPPGTSIAVSEQNLLAHGVAGFYDPRQKLLFIRDAMGDATRVTPEGPRDRDVLAHEIAHALQDQNFNLPSTSSADDPGLAYRALVEGDARLTEMGVHADALHQTPHWVSRAAWAITLAQKGDSPKLTGEDAERMRAELGRAPPYVRRVLDFPYVEGALFVAALRRAGGAALVDVAFAHPPQTTEQVMHPDKFIAGELAVPVATPIAPEGWHAVEKGSLGELRTSILIAECLPREEADRAATGWGGDAWSVLADDGGHRAIAWSTVWDDEQAATRFEAVVRGRGPCLETAFLDQRVGRAVTVRREGTRVAYVQGLPDALREPPAGALLAFPGERPAPRPPAGPVTIPPLVSPDAAFAHKGKYGEGTWTSDPLGMHMRIPDGFAPADAGGGEATMIDKDDESFVSFGIVFAPRDDQLEPRLLHDTLVGVRRMAAKHGELLSYLGSSTTTQGGRTVHEFKWTAGFVEVHVLTIPACSGQATVVLAMMWTSTQGSIALDRWLARFKLPSEQSPACEELQRSAYDQ